MIALARLALKIQRFEIGAAILIIGFLSIAAIAVRVSLDSIHVPSDCWAVWFGGGADPSGPCRTLATSFLDLDGNAASKLMAACGLAPLAAGLFLGAPVVAREIEGGTAPMAWALARSRSRWFLSRVVPLVAILVLLLGALAIASEILWSGREPWGAVLRFEDAGLHGSVVVGTGLAAFGASVLAGAVLGRSIPAVVTAAGLCLALYVGGQAALAVWLDIEAPNHSVLVDSQQSVDAQTYFPGGTQFTLGWQSTDGGFLTDDEATAHVPAGTTDANQWLSDHLRRELRGVPGSEYPVWALLNTAGAVIVGALALLAALVVVLHRRPI